MDLEKLKRMKKAERSAYTKALKALETLLDDETVSNDDIEIAYLAFEKKDEALENTHKLYLDEVPDDNFETEFGTVESFRDSTNAIKFKVQKRLNPVKKGNAMLALEDRPASVGGTTPRLPEIELKRFSGSIKEWLTFWNHFLKIHESPQLSDAEKFHYLLQSTVEHSDARELIETYPVTNENYASAVNSLKERYGRDDILIEVYVRDLIALVLQNNDKNKSQISLSTLYNRLSTQLRSLTSLKVTTEKYAVILFPLVESCLPIECLKQWERYRNNIPVDSKANSLDHLLTFLKQEVESEQRILLARSDMENVVDNFSAKDTTRVCSAAELISYPRRAEEKWCIFCKTADHYSKQCKKVLSMSVDEKTSLVKRSGVCFVCLSKGHFAKSCRSKIKCHLCKGRHLKMLCPQSENKNAKPNCVSVTDLHAETNSTHDVYLQTLVVKLMNGDKEKHVRIICDTGSSKSYILRTTVAEMGYEKQGEQLISHSLFGGVKTKEHTYNSYKIYLGDLNGTYICRLDALEQDIICSDIISVNKGPWINELKNKNIHLSDVNINSPIEVLLGSDVLGKLYTGRKEILSSGLVALGTELGWCLSGKIPNRKKQEDSCMTAVAMLQMTNLWELEMIGIRDPIEQKSQDEVNKAIAQHFQENVRVLEDGRYEVPLPWKLNHAELPENFDLALSRLETTCKKLQKDGMLSRYREVFCEWKQEGVIEEVPDDELNLHGHYLPHRPVIKESSTTKIRPVFDASAKTGSHPSLNDCLEKGANLIEDIPAILARFRRYEIGVISDIKKAFLQISLDPRERNFLRFLMKNKEGQIRVLRHRRVVFGLTSSPFLLGAVIQHHVRKHEIDFPETTDMLLNSFYVDNCVTSVPSEEELHKFIREATEVMKEGKFDLRGWENTELSVLSKEDAEEPLTNVLGLQWNKREDTLHLTFSNGLQIDANEPVTKRKILSVVNQIFDPIGVTAPALLKPKLLLQELWKRKTPWDSEVEEDLEQKFRKWAAELPALKEVAIPRWIRVTKDTSWSLHLFCDASQDAYAAVIFVRCEAANGEVSVQLVQAKSRVAPLKKASIPRMELLAATIGARLYASTKDYFKLDEIESHLWTDSSTVLAWIKRNEQWAVFVNNRIKEIKKLTPLDSWKHIPGKHNSADLPSRGCDCRQLKESAWWEGPEWLKLCPELWPKSSVNVDENEVDKEKRRTVVAAKASADQSVIGYLTQRISKFSKIVRVIAYILRWRKTKKPKGLQIETEEYCEAEKVLLRCEQKANFSEDTEKKQLKNLNIFTDEDGILRLQTRLTEEEAAFRKPIILPSKSLLVRRLIEEQHLLNKHTGTLTLLTLLRSQYWILKGRKTITCVLRKCVTCARNRVKHLNAPIPPLPKDRTALSHTFQVTGIDLAGPLLSKRGFKYWVVIFTCAVYRATHLELVHSLSTPAFVLALRRFISRRGRVSVIYSDNGTNFTGLHTALKTINWPEIEREFEVNKIQWKFIPPASPWWGGYWERLIRILKDLLRKNLGQAALEFEELSTLICECESIMNNRPLTYVSELPELRTLTPSMFLQSLEGNETPELDALDEKNIGTRWNYVQRLRNDLKQRFKKEYLGFLRSSRTFFADKIKVGDVVLIGSDDKKRLHWPLAVVVKVIPGRDNVTRLVKVKTSKGLFLRSIQRLYPLELTECNVNMDPEIPNISPNEILTRTRSGRTVKPPERFKF